MLPALTSLAGGRLYVNANAALAQLTIDHLAVVGGDLHISSNGSTAANTTSLSMAALTTVSTGLYINNNAKISSLSGFGMLTRVTGAFQIRSNPALPTCSAEALQSQVTAAGGIGGAVSVTLNLADGCS